MDPNLNSQPKDQPDELRPSAKLQAGYIRYIRIKPEEGPDGEICFETRIRRSQSGGDYNENYHPEKLYYTAVSYAWGDATARHPVIVDGHKRLVATNLWYFLQRANIHRIALPGTREERNEDIEANWRFIEFVGVREEIKILLSRNWPDNWLWIDALCIDQSDSRERAHQVGIMSEIFGHADWVISWLGPAYDNSDHAMSAILAYSARFSVKHQIVNPTELSEAICSLCERAYWKRLWVFQELRHAKDIILMCGEHWLSWDNFRNIWLVVVEIATTGGDASSERLRQSLATRMMTLRTKPMDLSLWNLLKETSNLECADARDRVFALLSVATQGHEGIKADYSPYMDAAGLGLLDLLDETESIPDTVYRQMVHVERARFRRRSRLARFLGHFCARAPCPTR